MENIVHNNYIKLGHKTIIEEYLKDIDAAEELKRQKLKLKRIRKKEKKKLLKLTQNTNTDINNQIGSQTPKNSKNLMSIKSANLTGVFTSPVSNHYTSPSPSDHGRILKFNATPEKADKINKDHSIGRSDYNDKTPSINANILQGLKKTHRKTIHNKLNDGNINEKSYINKNNFHAEQIDIKDNHKKMKKIANGKVEVIDDAQIITNNINNSASNTSNTMKMLIINSKLNQGNIDIISKTEKENIKMLEESKSIRLNKFDEHHMNPVNGVITTLKVNIQLSSSTTTSINNNDYLNDKEAELLRAMGWSENNSEDNIEIDQNEINQIKKKWKEIVQNRDVFRKNAREKFKLFISAASDTKSKF